MIRRSKPITRKPRRNDRPDVRAAYRETHLTCALCPNNWRTFGTHLDCHHIYGGARRVDIDANLLMLCQRCHARATANQLKKAHCLWLKREMGEFEPEVLQAMLKRFDRTVLPEPIEPPKEWRIGR